MSDTLKSLVDPGLQAEINKLIDSLNKTHEVIQRINSIPIGIRMNGDKYTSQLKSIDDLVASNNNLITTLNNLGVANIKMQQTAQRVADTQNKQAEALANETKQLEENIATRLKLQGRIESLNKDLKEDLDLKKKGVISMDEYKKRVIDTETSLAKYKGQLSETNKVITQQVSVSGGQTSVYKQLSKEFNELSLTARNYHLTLGENHPITKQAVSDANALGNKLKEVDAAVGINGRKVGGYADGVFSGFQKIYSSVRILANILPGIGISGIFLAAFEAVELLSKGTLFLTQSQKQLNDVYKAAAKDSSSNVAQMALLKDKINDLTISQTDRIKYAKEYNDIADKSNQIDVTQINNLSSINQKIEQQIGLIKQRAIAKAAENELAKSAEIVVQDQMELAQFEKFKDAKEFTKEQINKINKDESDQQKEALKINQKNNSDNLVLTSRIRETEFGINAKALDGKKKYLDAKKKLDQDEAKMNEALKNLSPLITPDSFSKPEKEKKATEKSVLVSKPIDFGEDQRKADAELLKEQFEYQKNALELKLSYFVRIAKDEKRSYNERIAAQEQATATETEILKTQKNADLSIIESKLKEIDKLTNEGGKMAIQAKLNEVYRIETIEEKKRTAEEKTNLNSKSHLEAQMKLLIDEDKLRQERINVIEKSETKQTEAIEKGIDARQKLSLEDVNKRASNRNSNIETLGLETQARALDDLNKKYREGKIDIEEYNAEKTKIANSILLKGLQDQQNVLEELKENYKKIGSDTKEIDKQIAQNKIKQIEIAATIEQNTDKDLLAKRNKKIDDIANYERKGAELIKAIVDGQFEERKNAIQKEIDLISQRQEADVAAVNSSTLNQQQKAARLLIIEQTANAQKQKLQREQRQEEIKKAKFDKEIAIFQIIVNTAVNVAKLLDKPFLAIAAGAIGAIELATAIATPIPKYAEGLNNATADHFGIYGEAGPELVTKPNKVPFIANKPTLDLLPRGTSIKPLSKILETSMVKNSLDLGLNVDQVQPDNQVNDKLIQVIQAMREVKQAIESIKPPQINIRNDASFQAHIDKNVRY